MAFVYLFLILMILAWSISFIIVDIAVESIPPLSLALYRFIVASACFLVLDIYFKIRKKRDINENAENKINSKFSVNQWILIIIASFTGAALFFFAQYSAIQLIACQVQPCDIRTICFTWISHVKASDPCRIQVVG